MWVERNGVWLQAVWPGQREERECVYVGSSSNLLRRLRYDYRSDFQVEPGAAHRTMRLKHWIVGYAFAFSDFLFARGPL